MEEWSWRMEEWGSRKEDRWWQVANRKGREERRKHKR